MTDSKMADFCCASRSSKHIKQYVMFTSRHSIVEGVAPGQITFLDQVDLCTTLQWSFDPTSVIRAAVRNLTIWSGVQEVWCLSNCRSVRYSTPDSAS